MTVYEWKVRDTLLLHQEPQIRTSGQIHARTVVRWLAANSSSFDATSLTRERFQRRMLTKTKPRTQNSVENNKTMERLDTLTRSGRVSRWREGFLDRERQKVLHESRYAICLSGMESFPPPRGGDSVPLCLLCPFPPRSPQPGTRVRNPHRDIGISSVDFISPHPHLISSQKELVTVFTTDTHNIASATLHGAAPACYCAYLGAIHTRD